VDSFLKDFHKKKGLKVTILIKEVFQLSGERSSIPM